MGEGIQNTIHQASSDSQRISVHRHPSSGYCMHGSELRIQPAGGCIWTDICSLAAKCLSYIVL